MDNVVTHPAILICKSNKFHCDNSVMIWVVIITGVTAVFRMFGRELKTKLPELRPAGNLLDEGVSHKEVHPQGTC